ncbi:MAG: DNA-binding response regulator [Bacteroidetes bacterium]|nr:MAG: DNA-binding response regulator [Bacteroidota bacterium]
MPNGSGFDLLDRLPRITFEIIFMTGFNDYVLDALKVSAVDYLLKPVATNALIEAVARSKQRITEREKIELYHVLRHNIRHLGEQDTKISIPGTQAYEFITTGDIIRCEGWQKYTRIFLQNGSCLVSSYNIGVFRDMLGSYSFFSTHKSHLINTKKIKRYLREGIVVMSDDSKVPVARRKRDDFLLEVL